VSQSCSSTGAFIADAFQPLAAEPSLADSYRRITYHRRGFGGSDHPPGPTSIAQQAADCRALLVHLEIGRAHVVGHSFGGNVALQLALDHPGVVHSLALLEPALLIGKCAEEYRLALARGAQRYREVGAAVVVDEFLAARWPEYRGRLDRILPGGFAQAVADAGTSFETDLAAHLAWRFDGDEARRITRPVLSVLGGESDALWARFGETHRWMLEQLPHAEGFVVPGATHLMHIQNPLDTAEGLGAFLGRHSLAA
jgi:pimeloyl-ACP methyl ester carboxylesterase